MVAKVFVSHSSADQSFARRLAGDLVSAGHRVFLDELAIKAGACIPTVLATALEECDFLVLVLSDHSVESQWVDEEWKIAYWEENNRKRPVVVPVLLAACEIPLLLRKRKYADFTADYDQGVSELLESIQAGGEHAPLFNEPVPRADAPEASVEPPLFPEAAQLADFMSDLSEEYFCARWLIGLEYDLWSQIVHGPRPWGYDREGRRGILSSQQLAVLRALSDRCGGWVVWSRSSENGHVFVPIEHWKAHVADPKACPLEDIPAIRAGAAVDVRRPLYGLANGSYDSLWFKHKALFFDRLVHGYIGYPIRPEDKELTKAKKREYLRLVQLGIVVPAEPTSRVYTEGAVEKALADRSFEPGFSHEFNDIWQRLTALQFKRLHGADTYPIYRAQKMRIPVEPGAARAGIVRLVLNKLPAPRESVSWEQIAEYRSDPDSFRRFAALRVWINDVVRRRLTIGEAADLLESLLADFEAHLRVHKLRFSLQPFGALVACDADLTNELIADRRIARSCECRGMPVSRLPLEVAELSAPGREVAYISFTNSAFGKA